MVDFREDYYTRQAAADGVKEYIRRLKINDIYIVLCDTNGIGSMYLNQYLPGNIN